MSNTVVVDGIHSLMLRGQPNIDAAYIFQPQTLNQDWVLKTFAGSILSTAEYFAVHEALT
jgi:hypothetical protein